MGHPRTKVDILAMVRKEPRGCWVWLGHIHEGKYGTVHFEGRRYMAHRLVWNLLRGEIPTGMVACHTCDNPPCCNPDHIFLGTLTDNCEDMVKKNRQARGVRVSTNKLTEAQVIRILKLNKTKNQLEIAKQFGVARTNVGAILRGETWGYLRKRYPLVGHRDHRRNP